MYVIKYFKYLYSCHHCRSFFLSSISFQEDFFVIMSFCLGGMYSHNQYLGSQAKSRGVKYVEAWPGGGWEE